LYCSYFDKLSQAGNVVALMPTLIELHRQAVAIKAAQDGAVETEDEKETAALMSAITEAKKTESSTFQSSKLKFKAKSALAPERTALREPVIDVSKFLHNVLRLVLTPWEVPKHGFASSATDASTASAGGADMAASGIDCDACG